MRSTAVLSIVLRGARVPFLGASLLPYTIGAVLARGPFRWVTFLLGALMVASVHLAANVLNDRSDSRSGADWHDRTYRGGLFGGSKLIQEGLATEATYLWASVLLALVAAATCFILAKLVPSLPLFISILLIAMLAWAYSAAPLRLSYRKLGEVVVFLLFGPALVVGGYFLQAGAVAVTEPWLASLPFGLLTTSILLTNEIPDYPQDLAAGKNTWVSLCGPERAHILYLALVATANLCLLICVATGSLPGWTLLGIAPTLLALPAAAVLRRSWNDKSALMQSSRLAITLQSLFSCVVLSVLIVRRLS